MAAWLCKHCCWQAGLEMLALAYCARLASWTVMVASWALVASSSCGRVAAGSLLSGESGSLGERSLVRRLPQWRDRHFRKPASPPSHLQRAGLAPAELGQCELTVDTHVQAAVNGSMAGMPSHTCSLCKVAVG